MAPCRSRSSRCVPWPGSGRVEIGSEEGGERGGQEAERERASGEAIQCPRASESKKKSGAPPALASFGRRRASPCHFLARGGEGSLSRGVDEACRPKEREGETGESREERAVDDGARREKAVARSLACRATCSACFFFPSLSLCFLRGLSPFPSPRLGSGDRARSRFFLLSLSSRLRGGDGGE